MKPEDKKKEWKKAAVIDERAISDALERGKKFSANAVRDVLAKAMEMKGVDLDELAALIQADDADTVAEIYASARKVKETIYGKRLVFFAPLYVSNYCVNNCRYCAYKASNHCVRRRLDDDGIRQEVKIIESMGHKRIALESGEDPDNCPIDYITHAMEVVYGVKSGPGEIRRVNVNIAGTTVDDYRRLKDAGIGTYVLFQETYHRDTYKHLHVGPKADYDWHSTAMDRALAGGVDDVGIGVLFGLYDWRFETLALLAHSKYLDREYGVGPHTISFPRLRPAAGMSLDEFPHLVADNDFMRIVASLRLAVPYTGMILSTREGPVFREEVIALGISQISGGSRTGVGEYQEGRISEAPDVAVSGQAASGDTCAGTSAPDREVPQFEVSDQRSLDEIIQSILPQGYIPSFCTACYRSGRTGERFMVLAKDAHIHEFCQPNAILTFCEYLQDYASPKTREMAAPVLRKALAEVEPESLRDECGRRVGRVEAGERDLYF